MTEQPHLRLVHSSDATEVPSSNARLSVVSENEPRPTRRLDVEDLYPDVDQRPATLSSALALLHEASQYLDEAITAGRGGDAIQSDLEAQKFFSLLPELFCCRSLGDGLGLCISSMFHAVQNLGGVPASEKQLLALAAVVAFLRKNTFCTIDTAISVVDRLESVDLEVDPAALDQFAAQSSEEVLS